MHCVSLLRTIFASLARTHGRVHVQNVNDSPQTKLDSEINSPFLLNEHGDLRFFFRYMLRTVSQRILENDSFLENSSQLGVFWPRRGLQANHGTFRKLRNGQWNLQIFQLFYLALFFDHYTLYWILFHQTETKFPDADENRRVRDVLFWKYQYHAMSRFVSSRDITCHLSFPTTCNFTHGYGNCWISTNFSQIFSSIVTSSKFLIEVRSLAHWTVDDRKCCFLTFFFKLFPTRNINYD